MSFRRLLDVRHILVVCSLSCLVLSAPLAQADLYVANSQSNNVTVSIGGVGCGFFSGTVPVGVRPVGVAVSPDGARAYTTNMGDGTVSVIDTALPAVTATVQVGGSPWGPIDAAVHPDGTRVYVISNNRVAVLNATSLTVTANVFVAGFANDLAVHPDGTRVYVTTAAGYVAVIDTTTNTVTAHVAVGTNVRGVAVNPAGTRLYVADMFGGSVAVLDTTSNAVIATVPVEGIPESVAINLDGSRVYVTNNLNQSGIAYPGKLTVIDTASNTVLLTQRIGASPHSVAVDRAHIYVTVMDGGGSQGYIGHLWVFDAATNAFVQEQPVGAIPAGVATFINPVSPPPSANVRVTAMEVTQGVQDLAQSVTLVAGRRTFVRVHVQADGPAVPNVTATLFGVGLRCTPTSCEGDVLGSLVPVNAVGTRLTVKPSPKRSNVDDSFLFELPWTWSNGGALRLHALVHADPGPPPATCFPDAPSATHAFDHPTVLELQFIRLAYTLAGTRVDASIAEQNQSESWIRRTFPLSKLVSGQDRVVVDPGLGTRVDQSAQECQDMKAADRTLCAQRYIVPKLAEQKVLTGAGFVGNADGAYGLIPQHPAGQFTRGACCTDGIGAGPSNDADYAAHEIGHLLGRHHPVQGSALCGHDERDFQYPYSLSLIHPAFPYDPATGLAGFDGGDTALSVASSSLGDFNGPYDVMGYCSPLWISDYTYRNLYFALRALHPDAGATLLARRAESGVDARPGVGSSAAAPQVGDWLTVFGSIVPDLATPAQMQTRRVDRVFHVPPRTPGSHSIRLIGADGATLADYPFTPDVLADARPTGGGSPSLGFGHVVPFVAGTREIRIVDVSGSERVLGLKSVSANPPAVGNVALQGAPDPATGVVTVGWTASDADVDSLTFDVLFTRDEGVSLQPLMLGLSGTSVEIDTTDLGGGVVQFRVMASDGVQSAFADTAPFSLAPRPPRPRILTPGDGTVLHLGQLVNLEGQATDPQDGVIPETGLVWSMPGRPLGSGSRLSITDLPAGVNQVTLTATNSLGLADAISVTLVVKENPGLPGPTLTAGPRRIGWHVAAGETQPQTSELEIGNSGGGNLEFTAQSSAPWLTVSAEAGTAPATLTVAADPAGLGEGVTAEASVTVTAVGMTGQSITVPVTLSVGNTFVVGNANPRTVDQCPDDPDKTQPGACGCGVPDTEAGQACTTGLPGLCGAGVTVCAGGSARCVQSQQPSSELCDGLDNDCNGTTDEGNPGGGAACSTGLAGVCDAGIQFCTNGALICQQSTQPGVEICGNNIDEDCNGVDLACPPPVDACTPSTVLDAFNRADGRVGSNWRGLTAMRFYRIAGDRLDVQAGGPLYWRPAAFGTSQAAFVTLSTVAPNGASQGLLLKVQSGRVPAAGGIAVVYDAAAHAVRVSTLRLGVRAWRPYDETSIHFDNGDKLGACATANGEVRVYKNNGLVKTVTLTAADQKFFNPRGGNVGVWSVLAPETFFDDFGGATVAP
jgi:YVTN family beta-propeller protein